MSVDSGYQTLPGRSIDRPEPVDPWLHRRMRREERRHPRPGERVRDVERCRRGIDRDRDGLDTTLEGLERVRERAPFAEQLRGGRVGEILALPRDGELQDHRRDRRDEDRRQRADDAERAVVLVAAEQPAELEEVRDCRDCGADHRGDRRHEDVPVQHVGELVREHAANLLAGEVAHEALGDGHGRVLRAPARRKCVRLLGRDQVQPRHRQAGPLRQILDVGVDLGCGRPLERLSAAHLQRDPVGEPVHREVEADRDQEEHDEPARTADEGAE